MTFIIEDFHHTSIVHERLCTKSFDSIEDILSFSYKGLFLVYLKALWFLYICSLLSYSGE
jgi:hypothetical protein